MFRKPWTYKEGIAVCLGILLIGVVLQLCAGPIDWNLVAWPANIILLGVYLAAIGALYCLRSRVYFLRWTMTAQAAVSVIITAALATVVYGITCDSSTLCAWPFVLLYAWLTTILGLSCIKRFKSVPFLLNHLGLFVAIVCATLGNADMQKLRMTLVQDNSEWRTIDDEDKVHELDFSIRLNRFTIEEYPPKLVVVSNNNSKTMFEKTPAELVLEDSAMCGELLGHKIEVSALYDYCAPYIDGETIGYAPWRKPGATTAALVSVDGRPAEWVSCGSYMFSYKTIQIDSALSIIMPECEPKRFTSNVDICARNGEKLKNIDIEVNKPFEMNGWKIYQLSYDNSKGRWSDISVLELVKDPWLPFVYGGIFVMLAGAVWMFVAAGGRKHD